LTQRDDIYANPLGAVADFSFDASVVNVFPDMINRSVPGYQTIVAMTGVMAARYYQPGTRCYDLGSSLGASTLSMARALPPEANIIAVDNSPAMIARCKDILEHSEHRAAIELRLANVQEVVFEKASVVVMNFTLQFIPREQRGAIIQRIADAMPVGGVLILSEKIAFSDEHLQQLNTDLHHSFKRQNGYSALEISQKRSALENVMIPETLSVHRERMLGAGFSSCDVWFQCFNFASIVAVK
jgi:tRNA (cmo5U34)-methyltransferase